MKLSQVISCLCEVMLLAIVVSCAPSTTTPTTSQTSIVQQNLKLLLDILNIYTKLQVNRIITARNEMKSEQEIIVKQFDQLLQHSSDIDSLVEEEGEDATLPLLATKTIIDLTLNQSYYWLTSTLGTDVNQSTVRLTTINLDVGSLSGKLSLKLRNPRNPSLIDDEEHCERIANNVMNMTDPATKHHILKSVSPFCAYHVSNSS